jgi:hypothetical protein
MYSARFKALSNWAKSAAYPFGAPGDEGTSLSFGRGKENEVILERWREQRDLRQGYADREHPFRHQGSADVNTYKLFLEMAHAGLSRGGVLGLLVPSGIYTDNGSGDLRRLFLKRCAWTHLYAFQNERFVFHNIDHRFKMAVVHVRKSDKTMAILTRFRIGPGDSPEESEVEQDLLDVNSHLAVSAEQISRFSPDTDALLEVRGKQDLRVLEQFYARNILLGKSNEHWEFQCSREFHMTDDSRYFPEKNKWEALGYRADIYGNWLKGQWRDALEMVDAIGDVPSTEQGHHISPDEIESCAVPLLQGIMVQAFDASAKAWLSGSGARAVWSTGSFADKTFAPHFLMDWSFAKSSGKRFEGWKIAYRRISRSTDARTWICTPVQELPGGDSLFFLSVRNVEMNAPVALSGILNSYAYDWIVRNRMGGTNLSWFILAETPVPRPDVVGWQPIEAIAWRLCGTMLRWAPEWLRQAKRHHWSHSHSWRRLWAVTPHERLRLRSILDALVAHLYGLDVNDFGWILRDCDHPIEKVCNKPFSRTLDPKGFWRVDKTQEPELRHPVLSLVAFRELTRVGLDAFLAQNDGEGWMLPETLTLADYGIGHDARAQEAQPVAARLGERFLPWQLEQGVEESWAECERHAETIERILGLKKPAEAEETKPADAAAGTQTIPGVASSVVTTAGQALLFAPEGPVQGNLFGRADELGARKGRKK